MIRRLLYQLLFTSGAFCIINAFLLLWDRNRYLFGSVTNGVVDCVIFGSVAIGLMAIKMAYDLMPQTITLTTSAYYPADDKEEDGPHAQI